MTVSTLEDCYLSTISKLTFGIFSHRKTIVVSTRLQANSVAYTSYTLPLHSDLPYYEAKPGVWKITFDSEFYVVFGLNSR